MAGAIASELYEAGERCVIILTCSSHVAYVRVPLLLKGVLPGRLILEAF